MTKAQKELLANCEPYKDGTPFDTVILIPTGKKYDGFWGENGYNQILVVCLDKETGKYYKCGDTYQVDVVHLENLGNINIDVPKESNCIRIFPNQQPKRLVINDILSYISIELYEERKKETFKYPA